MKLTINHKWHGKTRQIVHLCHSQMWKQIYISSHSLLFTYVSNSLYQTKAVVRLMQVWHLIHVPLCVADGGRYVLDVIHSGLRQLSIATLHNSKRKGRILRLHEVTQYQTSLHTNIRVLQSVLETKHKLGLYLFIYLCRWCRSTAD